MQHYHTKKSEILAEVCHRCFNTLLLSALRSDEPHRTQLYAELQDLLVGYLQPYAGNPYTGDPSQGGRQLVNSEAPPYSSYSSIKATGEVSAEQVLAIAQNHSLNSRQQTAIAHLLTHNSLTIQAFESLCPGRSRRTLQRDLKQLIDKGLVQTEGDTNQLTYRISSTA